MKKVTAYISSICFGLLLCSSIVRAQSGNEVKLTFMKHPLATDKNLVTVSTAVNGKQSASGNGIHFTLIVQNNSGKAITIANIADQLSVALYNDRGLDISVPNDALAEINRRPEDRKWRFRSESVIPDKIYINGKAGNNDPKKQEYIEIPAGGNCKVNLTLKNIKRVDTPKDVQDKVLKPTLTLAPGKYKLKLSLFINSKERSKSGGVIGGFQSPMIDIDYL